VGIICLCVAFEKGNSKPWSAFFRDMDIEKTAEATVSLFEKRGSRMRMVGSTDVILFRVLW